VQDNRLPALFVLIGTLLFNINVKARPLLLQDMHNQGDDHCFLHSKVLQFVQEPPTVSSFAPWTMDRSPLLVTNMFHVQSDGCLFLRL
jgi:hypothetical protein